LASQAASLYWNEADRRDFTKTTSLWKLLYLFHAKRLRRRDCKEERLSVLVIVIMISVINITTVITVISVINGMPLRQRPSSSYGELNGLFGSSNFSSLLR